MGHGAVALLVLPQKPLPGVFFRGAKGVSLLGRGNRLSHFSGARAASAWTRKLTPGTRFWGRARHQGR
jgi:hypothetical protein